MESLDEYMNKVISYMAAVNEKDELVTEGIKKLDKMEQQIRRYRVDSQKMLEEDREKLAIERHECNRSAFEMEQSNEKLHRMNEFNSNAENVFKTNAAAINKKNEKLMTVIGEEAKLIEQRRQVLSDKFNRNSTANTTINTKND